MPDTALLLSAWRRPAYFRQTLASWAAAPGLAELGHVTIALGRSPREDEQVQVIEEFARQAAVPVNIRWDSAAAVVSPSVHRALGEAIDSEFSTNPWLEFLICGEEDVIVSDDVLSYMTWAANIFRADSRVLTVSAHNPIGQGWHKWPPDDDSGADQEAVRLHPQFHPWVWATWRDRWEKTIKPDWDWDATTGTSWHDNGYDWQMCRIMERDGLYAVTPDASRSQNIGQYEGIYADPANFPGTQAASFRLHRTAAAYRFEGE